jgi:hypothetical protein
MTFPEQSSPALMLFHEKGELLFSNSGASELTGFSNLEMRRVEDCLARLFPQDTDLALISGIIRRVSNQTDGSDHVQFAAEFTTRAGNKRRGTFEVHVWREGLSGKRLLICLVPAPCLAPRQEDHPERGIPEVETSEVTDQVEELLDDAIGCILTIQREGCSKDRLDALVRKIARSRCLLGGTTGFDRVWSSRHPKAEKSVIPPRIKMSETKVDS